MVVEIHYNLNCMYRTLTDWKLQTFFCKQLERQFYVFDEKLDFAHTTIEFDLVYSMIHI